MPALAFPEGYHVLGTMLSHFHGLHSQGAP